MQISYDGDQQRVVVRSDHNNRGYYDECLSAKVVLPADWWRNAYIGVSASTGDLADNHDVLEISTVVGVSSLENEAAISQEERENAFAASLASLLGEEGIEMAKLDPSERALASLVKALSDAELDELEKLKRELEHSMSGRNGETVERSDRRLDQHDDSEAGAARRRVGGPNHGAGGADAGAREVERVAADQHANQEPGNAAGEERGQRGEAEERVVGGAVRAADDGAVGRVLLRLCGGEARE